MRTDILYHTFAKISTRNLSYGKKMLKKYCKPAILGLAAVAAGFVNGFLGTGGGIILIFALGMTEVEARDKFATVIAVILPLSLVSAIFYKVKIESAAPYLLPGMLGGATGAWLLDKINIKWLKKIFAIMVIWAGICFIAK